MVDIAQPNEIATSLNIRTYQDVKRESLSKKRFEFHHHEILLKKVNYVDINKNIYYNYYLNIRNFYNVGPLKNK